MSNPQGYDLEFSEYEDVTTEVSIIQILIDSGAPIDTPNNDCQTPLMVAAKEGNVAVPELLISRGALTGIYGLDFGSLLYLACKNNGIDCERMLEMVKRLIQAKMGPSAPGPNPFRDCLLYTIIWGWVEEDIKNAIIRYLVREGLVDVNVQGGRLGYAILTAAHKSEGRLVEHLIKHGTNIDVDDSLSYLLVHQVGSIKEDGSRRLVGHLARTTTLDVSDNYGQTSLHYAAGLGNLSVCKETLNSFCGDEDINLTYFGG
ncbi:hypothetical protein FZEAL_6890 [Fusarium zealandicum]|uniref:Ankyrin repeat protein n=1 Tax=Fusarium zealandicum TaxID=1053134 RepID=A0A8H4UHH2_9HYPO|nr:hypothetical protein FZEAL_6890 [Fusarium zealandicum]